MSSVANHFGVSPDTVRKWLRQGCPGKVGSGGRNGKYDLKEIDNWCKTNGRGPYYDDQRGETSQTKAELELRKLEIECRQKEFKLKKEQGEYIRKDAVLSEFMEQNANIRSRLEAMPAELAASYPPEMRVDMIADTRHKIGLILKELEERADGRVL